MNSNITKKLITSRHIVLYNSMSYKHLKKCSQLQLDTDITLKML